MGQQNPNPQPEGVGRAQGKNRRERPFGIEGRSKLWWKDGSMGPWRTWGHYRTESERDAALENLARKYENFMQFRAQP